MPDVVYEHVIRAELHSGAIRTLRGGFASAEAAAKHPVDHSLWKRVWVEETDKPFEEPEAADLPPFPWSLQTSRTSDLNGQFHAYLVDANGKKFAALWGRGDRKRLLAEHILKSCAPSEEP